MRKLVILFGLLLSFSLIAQEDDKKWTIDHIINTKYVGSVNFSPDGNTMVWTKRRGLKDKDKFINDIYLTRLDLVEDGLPRTFRLTNSDDNDYSPIFSRNGEDIYFLSSRDKGKKLWKMSIFGGEPIKVKDFPNGIGSLKWLNDNTLLYTAHDGKTLYDEINEKDNTDVIEDSVHRKITKVFAFNLEKKTSKRLTNNTHPISSFSVSKNGRYIVAELSMSMHYRIDGKPKPQVHLYDLQAGSDKLILKDYHEPRGYRFTEDNTGFYFSAETSEDEVWKYAGKTELYYYDLDDGTSSKVALQWDNGIGGGYAVSGNDVIASLANGAYRTLAFYKKSGDSWTKQVIDLGIMNDHVRLLGLSENGSRMAFQYSTASKIPEFRVVDFSKRKKDVQIRNNREFVKLNKNLKELPITKSEVYKWIGANNEEVNGMLYYPENYEPGKQYPLMLSIHGGPTGVDSDAWSERWSTYPQILAQRGAFVLKPNYHGSSNHGREFAESISSGVYYDLEEIDIINGINSLNDKGMIDMDMLGVMGWSNGAILATMLTVRYPEMFKVCAAGAGDVNWTSDYGTCGFGVIFDEYYLGGAPWDDVDGKTYNEKYIIKSPLFEIEKIKTPTIIFHGSEDRSVPRDQGWEYYRGLQQVGKAPVRFLWFPGQPHGLQKITHQKRKMKEELAWIDTYLFKTYKPENESFKKESPLGNAITLSDYAMKSDGLYGKVLNNKLIPQTTEVKNDSIAIGVFEVTNAQVKALVSSHNYDAGMENHPAVGMSQEQINNYITVLNAHADKNYRLPNAAEAKALHKNAGKVAENENTLKYWAGYDLTQSDVNGLLAKVDESNASLLFAVGKFKYTKLGSAKVYDLGGNAAEFYNDNGQLKSYGYSAYDFFDKTAMESKTDVKYCGFRLILD